MDNIAYKNFKYFLFIIGTIGGASFLFTVNADTSIPQSPTTCPDSVLISRDLLHAKADSLELLEIIRRIDSGNIESARSLADSYLDAQIQLAEQLAATNPPEESSHKASEIIERVKKYREQHK